MDEFKTLFENYGGDYAATMERFMGNRTLYLKLLDMLFQDPNLQNLGDALDAGDLTAAFEAAHTLKGVVGNMGLTPLYTAACAIVEPLRGRQPRDDYPELYRAVQTEFQNAEELRGRLRAAGLSAS